MRHPVSLKLSPINDQLVCLPQPARSCLFAHFWAYLERLPSAKKLKKTKTIRRLRDPRSVPIASLCRSLTQALQCPHSTICVLEQLYMLCVLILQAQGMSLCGSGYEPMCPHTGDSSPPHTSRPFPRTMPSAHCLSSTVTLCFTSFSRHTVSS